MTRTSSLARENRIGVMLAAALSLCVTGFFLSFAARPGRASAPAALRESGGAMASAGPLSQPPSVEPLEVEPLDPADAKARNASVPFVSGPNPAARPFIFTGGTVDFARATDCLASAVLFEAGDDKVGQQAVAQVIVNRARHPAFPASICGVVFQGSERRTGCQFTYTCDGSLARRYPKAAWERARGVAGAALSGFVYAPVGWATHYHTDWVVPYWSSSVEKIAAVGSHLFFRWAKGWGQPAAFRQPVTMIEAAVPKLAALSPVHAGALDDAPLLADAPPSMLGETLVADANALKVADARIVTPASGAGTAPPAAAPPAPHDTIILTFDRATSELSFEATAKARCGDKRYCKVLAWISGQETVPTSADITDTQRRTMAFSYLRNTETDFEKSLWNCRLYPNINRRRCMSGL